MASAYVMVVLGGDALTATMVCIFIGVIVGLINGFLIVYMRVPDLLATLGMMWISLGLAVWLAGRTRVSFRGARPEWVDALSRTSSDSLIFDPGVWSAALLAVWIRIHVYFVISLQIWM